VVGAIGEPDRLDYTVVGNPVNLAAKLEKHTRIERVEGLAWLATYRLAGEQGLAQSADPAVLRRAIAGLSDPVDLVVLA
jgi:adenylate cyclase